MNELRKAFEGGAERDGFRLVHWSVQTNHFHLIVEAPGRRALSRGVQGLLVRVARALNRAWKRAGSVFADRYYDHVLRTPKEVRNALAYVLCNARHHGIHLAGPDPFSTAAGFEGWARQTVAQRRADPTCASPPWHVRARTWLLDVGWRRWGLL